MSDSAAPPPDDDPTKVSRRTFLKTAGVSAAATSVAQGLAASAGPTVLGPDAVPLTLKINGAVKRSPSSRG